VTGCLTDEASELRDGCAIEIKISCAYQAVVMKIFVILPRIGRFACDAGLGKKKLVLLKEGLRPGAGFGEAKIWAWLPV